MKLACLLIAGVMVVLAAAATVAQDKSQPTAPSVEQLGKVFFPVSCTPAAQQAFDRALAMLHSFWLPQATRAFEAVVQADPDCAIAHWGIAMSQRGNPLVGAPSAAANKTGWAAVEKARTLGPKTQRERDYVAAMEAYFKDWETVDHARRVLAYERAMEQLHTRYPTDPEAATLYALALNEALTVLPADKTYTRHLKAAALCEQVLLRHPDHPGALHYLIHSYDFPQLAHRGLAAAHRYDMVASAAPHALHMPSHIFSMAGMWQESIKSNRTALQAAKSYVHAMDFIVYAQLQGAQDIAAKRMVDEAAALLSSQAPAATLTPTAGVLAVHTAFAAIPARFAIERGAWGEAAALTPRPSTPAADAITHFTRAVGALRSGNRAAAQSDIEQLDKLHETLAQAKQGYWAEQVDIQRRAARAWVAFADGQKDQAVTAMRAAADLEDASEKHVAMENRLWPMRELLAELLLELKRPAAAAKEFEASLQTARNRWRGIYGAARAYELAGDREKARAYYARLIALAQHTDTERPELRHAKAFVAAR
jgi:tetratricopeptide (TPR) repeat protein